MSGHDIDPETGMNGHEFRAQEDRDAIVMRNWVIVFLIGYIVYLWSVT